MNKTSSERFKEEDCFETYIRVKSLVYFLYKCYIPKLKTGLVVPWMDEGGWQTQTSSNKSLGCVTQMTLRLLNKSWTIAWLKYQICQQRYARYIDIHLETIIKIWLSLDPLFLCHHAGTEPGGWGLDKHDIGIRKLFYGKPPPTNTRIHFQCASEVNVEDLSK